VLFTFLINSCRKHDQPAPIRYQIEKINKNNFNLLRWREQQVNNVFGGQIFSDESNYVEIVCGPENNSDPHLLQGCITMNLPTSDDATLRRIRLRRVGYNTWQQWDALHGTWHIEAGSLPEFPDGECTIEELISVRKYGNARIIDTEPIGHNGEGVRFTIGEAPDGNYLIIP
jgi:hypothetical protein